MRLTRFEPFRFADALQADVQRREARRTAWQPAADIVEYADAYLVRLDVPGVSKDAIDIETDKGLLSISGERPAYDDGEDARLTRSERLAGKFVRRFTLPDSADVEQIRAQAREGILEVRIPKLAEVQPRKISVEAA
ncbi:MAG: Hsp20/alpha crystallin family protein [Pseudomonadota bacterium]